MKSLKTLLLTKSIIAAAVAAGSLATPAISHAIAAGGPASGVVCRAGYTGAIDGGRFKCSKANVITVVLECNTPNFSTYVVRAPGAPGTPDGKDICTRNGVSVGSTDSVVNLVRGQDYEFAKVNSATVTTRTNNQDQTEASSLGLSASDVDTVAGQPVIVLNGGVGSKDNANVTLTHFTFAIQTGIIGGPLSIAR